MSDNRSINTEVDEMAVNHRALFTWFMLLVFLILLVLRMDGKVTWNWFIIFIPMWVFDALMAAYISFYMILHCKNGFEVLDYTMTRKVFFLVCLLLKMSFQVMLCLRLQYYHHLASYFLMMPVWVLLLTVCSDVFWRLIRIHRR